MLATLLICAVTLGAVERNTESYDNSTESTYTEESKNKKALWDYKRSVRIGYETHTFQNEQGGVIPMSFGVGISRVRNAWLHKKPIAGVMKFSFDRGISINYGRFDSQSTENDGYTGPSGFVGNAEDIDEESTGLAGLGGIIDITAADIGLNYASIGYALGASLTINPAGKLNINGYAHFVPSISLLVSGSSIYTGFMPYMRYGAELSLGRVGFGAEYVSGVSEMMDIIPMVVSYVESGGDKAATSNVYTKHKYYSNFMKIYMVFHMGKRKK